MSKAIITVVGKDTVGIIAKVCTYLAENRINILDISQTIVQDYFNMMMIVDVTSISQSFGDVAEELEQVGEAIGVKVKIQREDIFTKMHRIRSPAARREPARTADESAGTGREAQHCLNSGQKGTYEHDKHIRGK